MYNWDEIDQFNSPEIRLKQLLLNLKEQEKTNQSLKSTIKDVNNQLTASRDKISKEKAGEVSGAL